MKSQKTKNIDRKIFNGQNDLQTSEKMRAAEVTPPPYIWDRIEQVLDMQLQRHQIANELIASSFRKKNSNISNF